METRLIVRASQRLKLHARCIRHVQTRPFSNETSKLSYRQANPIGDYYSSLLEQPTPAISLKPPTSATQSRTPTTEVTEDSRPKIIFSSRLSSPLERRSELQSKSKLIAGVWVPPRPEEPDDCCMSGCVNCVYDRYRDELEEWAATMKAADIALKKESAFERERRRRLGGTTGTGLMLGEVEKGAQHTMTSMDDDGGGSDSNWDTGFNASLSSEDLFKTLPVGIREFMKTEKRLKEKHARERAFGG